MAEGSGAGQFFTPGSIVRLLVEMLEPYKGRIFDPACGSGGMFVQSLKFLTGTWRKQERYCIYGQEMTAQTLRLCLMNLMLRNLSFDIKLGNSLLQDKFPILKADYIIANPPFNVTTGILNIYQMVIQGYLDPGKNSLPMVALIICGCRPSGRI